MPPAKCFTESILQNYLEESLPQIISEAYDYRNDATHFLYPDAQILGIQKVVPFPYIPEAPASPCNVHDYPPRGDTGTMSLTEILFGTPDIQKASESGIATDARSDREDVPMDEDSASVKEGNGYAAAESEDELVFETVPQSPMTNQTRSKSRKVIITDAP